MIQRTRRKSLNPGVASSIFQPPAPRLSQNLALQIRPNAHAVKRDIGKLEADSPRPAPDVLPGVRFDRHKFLAQNLRRRTIKGGSDL